MFRNVLKVQTAKLGPKHPSTVNMASNLAGVLSRSNKLKEAADLERSVVEARTEILGPEHPKTLAGLQNWALTKSRRGDTVGAISLLERVLASRSSVLGPQHPSTVSTLANLGRLYLRNRRFEDAEASLTQALRASEAAYGAG